MLVSFEGNIGAGKTKFFEDTRRHLDNVIFLREPLDEWTSIRDNASGQSLLEAFYRKPTDNAFSFQINALISRFALLETAIKTRRDETIISERSLTTDSEVFARMLYADGHIRQIDYDVYTQCHDYLGSRYPIQLFVYIRTDPSVCFSRVRARDRRGESGITIEYLEQCHQYHEAMIEKMRTLGKRVIVFNGNIDLVENPDEMGVWRRILMQMLEQMG